MQLATIEIDRDMAKARLDEYTESLRHDRNTEDEAIARAYRAAAQGLPIIRLSEAVHAGGYFDNGLPRIAVVRADAKRCWIRRDGAQGNEHTVFVFAGDPDTENRGALVGRDTVRVEVPVEHNWRLARYGTTMAPSIPPNIRPKRWRLHRFHVLWEVEEWQPVPPRDPALIKHIGGDLWSVHAVWDLTELERAVLMGIR